MGEPYMSPPPQQAPAADLLLPLGEVAQGQALAGLARRLAGLRAWLQDDLGVLEAALAEVQRSCQQRPVGPVGAAAAHLLAAQGKRIRPICALLAARIGPAPQPARARATALACEMVHAATLLHDDVIDEARCRRGVPAARVVWGNSVSILAGNHLLTSALQQVTAAGGSEAIASLLGVLDTMVAAEAMQLQRRGQVVLDRDAYLMVVRGKTASLFSWALAEGGRTSGCDGPTVARLSAIGLHLGTAFQLTDDLLDLVGDAQLTGKEALADLRQGKLTWPMLLACEADPQLHAQLVGLAAQPAPGSPPQAAEPADAWVQRLRRTDALAQTRTFARAEAARASEQIDHLPASRARLALQEVVAAAVLRAG